MSPETPSTTTICRAQEVLLDPESDRADLQTVLSPLSLLRLKVNYESIPSFDQLVGFLLADQASEIAVAYCRSVVLGDRSVLQVIDDCPLFCRLDSETLQARYLVRSVGIELVLQWYSAYSVPPLLAMSLSQWAGTTIDLSDSISGWRVERLQVPESSSASDKQWVESVVEAEADFQTRTKSTSTTGTATTSGTAGIDDDDDYWAMYDSAIEKGDGENADEDVPEAWSRVKTPAAKSPACRSMSEEDYFRQYDTVQPALDPDEPVDRDERVERNGRSRGDLQTTPAGIEGKGVVGPVGNHVRESVRSLFRLARSAGVAPAEFMSLVSGAVGDELGG